MGSVIPKSHFFSARALPLPKHAAWTAALCPAPAPGTAGALCSRRSGVALGVRGDQSTDTEELRPLRRALQEGSGVMKIILTIKKTPPQPAVGVRSSTLGSQSVFCGWPYVTRGGASPGAAPSCHGVVDPAPRLCQNLPLFPHRFFKLPTPALQTFRPFSQPTHKSPPKPCSGDVRSFLPDTRASLRGGGTDKLTPLRRSGDEKP